MSKGGGMTEVSRGNGQVDGEVIQQIGTARR